MKILGHRGAGGSAPENTLLAFRRGLEFGVDGFEFDVQLSRDGEVVVIHDERVNRTSDGTGWVKDFTLRELKRLDFGGWFAKCPVRQEIPTLREVLAWVQASGQELELNVEIKSGLVDYPRIADKVVSLLYEYGMVAHSFVSSFDHQVLADLREQFPEVRTGILYDSLPVKPWLYAKYLQAAFLHPPWYFVRPELVQAARAAGIGVNTWTVNDSFAADKVRAAGVERIITDYPERFAKNAQGEAVWREG